ncbi:hypothetical protein Ndes2526B_g01592 [Nannochloris sp. 'desiccata']|nr:hypothetical protein KSW81_005906 [Chlorella desiccata (nom. nud.)]KAH7623173.1 hypothetical protein NADE_002367 [Chlorella desiccata (nom. nud.)]
MSYAMPLKNPYQTPLAIEKSPNNIKARHQHPNLAKSFFERETQNLAAFCEAWISQLSRGARDPFSWIQELTPAEGLVPFAVAVPTHNHGGAIGRSLERYGSWQPELTEDLLDALDQAGPDSVFLDIGAGLGWFSFVAAAANHSVLALEIENLNIAAVRRSFCANNQNFGDFTLLGSSETTSTTHHALGVTEMLLNVSPRMIEGLSAPSSSQPREPELPGDHIEERIETLHLARARGSAVLVHPATTREVLEVMAAGASVVWPEIKPLAIAMVLPVPTSASGGESGPVSQKKTEEIASLVFHRMHALGYDVRMDAASNMAQSPAAFDSLAAMVASGRNSEMLAMWFTWRG